jgi:Ca-activated chloride channel family protein
VVELENREEERRRFKLFPRRGYILFLVGVLVGFLLFALISVIFQQVGARAITFLYTSEKQSWIEEVTPLFEEWYFSTYGERIHVELVVTGTHDSVVQILWGNVKPVAWSPASSIWVPYLEFMWRDRLKFQSDIVPDTWNATVLSPVVIAGWESAVQDYNISGFRRLFELAATADFKYGHPDPRDSNGGTMTVALEFAAAANKEPEVLNISDFTSESVLADVSILESKSVYYGKSTGFFGRWAADNGPSAITYFSVYESVVLDNALSAEKKWGEALVAVYPENGTLFTDHPFVVFDAPWVEPWQRDVAQLFLSFLLNEENQEKAQQYGFRPANPAVALNTTVFNEENGVRADISDVPELAPLQGEVLDALFTIWVTVRNQGT